MDGQEDVTLGDLLAILFGVLVALAISVLAALAGGDVQRLIQQVASAF